MIKAKLKAASIHLSISFFVITLLVGLIIYFWFPSSIIKVSNFKEIAFLIVGIDLIIGPLLTFVVYKQYKKGLKFDLTFIALVQVSALLFGLYNLYKVHPVYITFNVDRFTLVRAVDAQPERATIDKFNISKLSPPKMVVSKLPTEIKERNKLTLNTLETGTSNFELKSEYYQSYEDNLQSIIEKSLDPDIVFKEKESQGKLRKFLSKYGKKTSDYAYLPLEGTAKDAIWVLDIKTAKPIDVISINPWTIAKNNQ